LSLLMSVRTVGVEKAQQRPGKKLPGTSIKGPLSPPKEVTHVKKKRRIGMPLERGKRDRTKK